MNQTNLLPLETLFAAPCFSLAQISPDGKRIAYLAPWRGRLNVFVRDLARPVEQGTGDRRVTADTDRNIDRFCWSPDATAILYLQDSAGDENWHLYRAILTPDKPDITDLTPFSGMRVMEFGFAPNDPNTIYLQMNARDPALVDLHRLDVATGELSLVATNPGRFVLWIVSSDGTPYGIVINPSGDYELSRYDGGGFVPVARFPGADYPFGPTPCVSAADGRGFLIGSNSGTDRTRLARIDAATGEETEIDSHPVYDLDTPRTVADTRFAPSLILNPVTGALLGARYLGERQVIHPLDPHFATVLERLSTLDSGDLGYLFCDASGQRWTAEFQSDRNPGTTWFYDHATGEATVIGRRQPDLPEDRLAEVRPLTVTSRDGLSLPCHLTLPLGPRSQPLPAVLLVHGGPWYRDCALYDPEVQFLANRGYAVLQVNMRGSTGYGKAFMQAARGEFAGRMHDDLLDALDWTVAQGIADPDRVAIYGCSYGGYASLVGASFTPDRFAAAICYSGMSDLRNLVEGALPFIRETLVNSYIAYMGDPEIPAQNDEMFARSPVSRLDQVRCPVLVVHGAQDVRVRLGQAEAVVSSLRARGAEVEFLVNPDEGHWFINEESNHQLYRTIESFLSRHIRDRASG